MKYTHIVWDFNGTILNDVDEAIKSVNTVLERRNMNTLADRDSYHKVFTFPITDYYKALGFDFDKEPYSKIAVEWVEQYLINSKEAKLYDKITEIFDEIKKLRIKQVILSATEKDMLVTQLKGYDILHYFDDILGLDNIYAHSKVEIAKEWVHKENPKKAVMIGDTTHDFEVASAMEIDCILVANGHQSKGELQQCGCIIIDDIAEITQFLH